MCNAVVLVQKKDRGLHFCNAVVFVQKKDRGLHFCISFQCLNAHKKKDSYPLPRIQEALESLVGAGHFFVPKPKVWILTNQDR